MFLRSPNGISAVWRALTLQKRKQDRVRPLSTKKEEKKKREGNALLGDWLVLAGQDSLIDAHLLHFNQSKIRGYNRASTKQDNITWNDMSRRNVSDNASAHDLNTGAAYQSVLR
jgi:hypothetical protein